MYTSRASLFSFSVYLAVDLDGTPGLLGRDFGTAEEAATWITTGANIDAVGMAQLRAEDFDLRLTLYQDDQPVALVLRLAE